MLRIFILAAAYLVTGWLGLKMPYSESHITLFWLPTGIAVATMFKWGLGVWPGVYLGAFLVNLSIGSSLPLAAGISIGNTLGPLLSTLLLTRAGFHSSFDRQKDVVIFIMAACAGMTVSAIFGTTSLYEVGLIPRGSLSYAGVTWWMGDTIGVLLAAPFLLTLTRNNLSKLIQSRKELFLWMLVAVPVAWLAFIQDYAQIGSSLGLAFLTLILIAWAALRFGSSGAALAGLGFSIISTWSTITGRGFFLLSDVHTSLFLLWSYMATAVLMGLLITALQAEQLRVEGILRLSEEKLRELYELSPLGIALTDMQGRYIEFNSAFQKISGYLPDELKSLDYWALTPKKYEAEEARQLESLIRTGHYGPYEKEYIHKDGNLVPLQLNGMLVEKDGKKYIWSIVQDITEQKLAEDKLRIAAISFETHESIMITDSNATILRVNHAFQTTTGYSAEDVIGRNPRILSSGRQSKEFYTAMWKQLLATGSWTGEIWDKRKNGQTYPKWMTITAVNDNAGKVSEYVAIFSDISARKKADEEIYNLAFYDMLTKLPNRRFLLDRIHQAQLVSARSHHFGALLFLDMDRFKTLNDTLGHDIGDWFLIEVARRLLHCVRDIDTVARIGGDEFVVLIEEVGFNAEEGSQKVALIAEKIRVTLAAPYLLKEHEHHSSPSIGVCLYRGNDESMDALLKHADMAMYQAKESGRNGVRFFDPAMQIAVEFRAKLEADLRHAVPEKQLLLYYQIQLDNDLRPMGAEALIRWAHPARGMVSPAQFIPVAEESSLILVIGHWVLETACKQLAMWSKHEETCNLTLAVNVSAQQFKRHDFVDSVTTLVNIHQINPTRLKLELTESVVLNDVADVITKMHALKALGVKLSLDDFGTGYSSLSYLKQLPLDQIKIDQSFVRDMTTDPSDAVMVQTIINLAYNFRLNVIAEGVETDAQLNFLRKNGCMEYQGYLFSKPVPIADFEALLKVV